MKIDLADDCGEDEDSEHVVDNDEGKLEVVDRQIDVGNRCHNKSRPEVGGQIHASEWTGYWIVDAPIDKVVGSETNPCTQLDVKAGVPVNDY